MKYRIKAKTYSNNGTVHYWPQKRFFFWWVNISGVSASIYQAKKDIEEDKVKPKSTTTYIDYEKWKK